MRQSQVPHCNLLIEGSQAPKRVMRDLLECVVENSVHLPDVCTLRIHDAEFHWLDDETFKEGTFVTVQLGFDRNALTSVFHGEVTGLELDLSAHHVPTMVVRLYDRSHRLHRGRVSRAFVNVTDTDLVKKIGTELGFEVDCDDTGQVHDWVMQRNQTNWEFLTDRAQRNGFRLFVKGQKKLTFKKVGDAPEGVVPVEWGLDLRSFRPRTSVTSQVDEVTVRGWDPKTKREIVGTCRSSEILPEVGNFREGSQLAKKAFGPAKTMVVDKPVHSQKEAEDLARSVQDQISGEYLQAEGLCDGNAAIKPGVCVEIKNIGKRFGGKYYVTSATHVYSSSEGYSTQFAITGKNPGTILSILDREAARGPSGGSNVVVGIVTDNRDPMGMGRVKVKYPWLTNDHTSYWARTVSQMAGKGRGMFNLPEIDDEVLVVFEQGEISRPYVLGQLWNGKDSTPSVGGKPELGGGSEVNRRGFVTRIGHQMTFDDTGGQGEIAFKTAGGHHVVFDDANKKVEITTTGGHKLLLDDMGRQALVQTTSGHMMTMSDIGNSITLKDNKGDVLTMSMGTVNLTALSMLNLAAPVINITGSMSVTMAAQTTTISAGMMATVSAGIGVAVSGGAMVTVTGGALVGVTGALVNIN